MIDPIKQPTFIGVPFPNRISGQATP